jgi:hypothetical protein
MKFLKNGPCGRVTLARMAPTYAVTTEGSSHCKVVVQFGMKILACLVLSISSLGAGSITYFASTTFGAADVFYTEIVTTEPHPGPPGVQEVSTPCVFATGCSFGSFSYQFPQIVVPAGSTITSAELGYGFQYTGGSETLMNVFPIDPGQPATPSSAGSYYENASAYFNGLPGLFGIPIGLFGSNGVDYTGPVEDALLNNNGYLAPIIGHTSLEYGFQSGLSPIPGVNSITIYNKRFLMTGQAGAGLTVNFDTTPEPSTAVMCLTGTIVLLCGIRSRCHRPV